jgi:phosphoribosylformylglycinamidine (FGAM) synthase-like amidotransferase family enzyme
MWPPSSWVAKGEGNVDLEHEVVVLLKGQERMSSDLVNLEERFSQHEKRQNGSIQRIEEKMEKANNMMTGLMGSAIISLVLLIANLLVKK